ncbi:MAG: type VI secretion system ATPase TssH [Algicola sp.]|nr:type VI secretion system ATPase TssH [Algicola sp.]
MEKITLKSYVSRLNPTCTKALEGAAGVCVANGGFEISVEHFLLKLLEDENDVALIFAEYDVNITRYVKNLQHLIEHENQGNKGKPVFSKMLIGLLEDAWLIASLEQGLEKVRSGSMVLAMLANPRRHGMATYIDEMDSISYDHLKSNFANAVADSVENKYLASSAVSSGVVNQSGVNGNIEALQKYCVNYTQLAKDGKIDPVFCRDREIHQMIDILARRRKNNPICVGEAGVGKTAVVEGLALKLVEGDVPDMLKDVDIYCLDLGLLQAGASVKGEFENRLTGVINAVKASVKPIILFIDEAHTLIGAGGAAGSGDAANLLKPALARGELRTIAATTWSEYKKYFEKDPALARRFQLVKLEEPTPEQAIIIIRGIRATYEKSHGVYVRDDAVVAAATLSARYINGRQLPDKAVDVLDTAAARVKISIDAKPEDIGNLEREIQTIIREHDALKRDVEAHICEDNGSLPAMMQQVEDKQVEVEVMIVRWREEQGLAKEILALRQQMTGTEQQTSDDDESVLSQQDISQKIIETKQKLEALQGETPLVHYEVSPDVVGQVISNWTGIPLGKMVKDEAKTILTFAKELGKRIKGQDHAIAAIDKGVRAAKAGINNPDTPMGVFLFVGPSGVGKTEMCIGVADLLFGGERFLTSVNMSEFQEKHSVSRLIGSPPGYVGYGEGGMLTEAVRQRPYSVVLLDEVEKADLEVLNLFYQVFDKGVLSDGEGQLVDFKNTIMFLTSNLASDIVTKMCATEPMPSIEQIAEAIRPVLSQHFKPALLARMQVVPFYPIGSDIMGDIVRIKLNKVLKRLEQSHQLALVYDDEVIENIAARCTDVESGARNVDHILNGTLLPLLATEILSQLGEENDYTSLNLSIGEDRNFAITFS